MTPGELLSRAAGLDAGTARELGLAWDAAWHADGSPAPEALEAARKAAEDAGLDWHGTRKAAWHAVVKLPEHGYPLRRAVSDAAGAVLARGLISDEDFAALTAPWRQVTGETP